MKRNATFVMAAAVIASMNFAGCREVTGPADQNREPAPVVTQVVESGEETFKQVVNDCAACLSLDEAVALTPFIVGTRTGADMTVDELVALTPTVAKFQRAFRTEVARLSVEKAVALTGYMQRNEKVGFPFPHPPYVEIPV